MKLGKKERNLRIKDVMNIVLYNKEFSDGLSATGFQVTVETN